MRSPRRTASSMSWVTNRIVLCTSAWTRRNSACSRPRAIGSIAENGSSISRTRGGGGRRPGGADPLPLPAGELGGIPLLEGGGIETDQFQQLPRAGLLLMLVPAQQPRHGRHVRRDVLVR